MANLRIKLLNYEGRKKGDYYILILRNVITSDRRFKEGITQIDNPLEVLKKINGYHYNFRKDVDTPFRFPDKRQYGLIAQEVQEVLPELVDVVDSNGHLGVNYDMIIPFLVEAVKQQQEEIEALKSKQGNQDIPAIQKNPEEWGSPSQGNFGQTQNNSTGFLGQNTPNPFSGETTIPYQISMDREAVQSASIWITDLNGNLKADYGVEDLRGEVTVSSAALQPGIYLYSLIINGEVADTKKMVIK